MINFDHLIEEGKVKHNQNYPYIPDNPYRLWMIIGGSGSGKTNMLFNSLHQKEYEKMYFKFVKDQGELKYAYLIDKRQRVGIKHCDPN